MWWIEKSKSTTTKLLFLILSRKSSKNIHIQNQTYIHIKQRQKILRILIPLGESPFLVSADKSMQQDI